MKKRHAIALPLVILAGCLGSAAPRQEGPRDAAETALKDRDWAKAATLLTDAIAKATSGQDELLYLLAVAHQQAGKHDDAIAALDRLTKEHPGSLLKMKAAFKKGDVLAAKKEFAMAGQIYETQVAAITAPERRKRLAMVYVEAGREFLLPKDAKDPTFVPNHAAAHNLLTKALDLEALGTDEEAVRANVIECELKGQFARPQLLKSCETFEEKFAASAKMDEVLFAKGAALRDLGRPWEARAAWVKVADGHAASKKAPEALHAAALMYVTETGATADLEALRLGLPLLRRLAKDFAASEQGPKAALLVGLALSQYEDLRDEARTALLALAVPEALLRVAQLHREDRNDAAAIAVYEEFLKKFPDSALWPQVRASIADVRFEKIDRAARKKDWAGLRTAAQQFVALHATDGRAATAEIRHGESFKEEKKFKEAVESWMKTAAKYPGHDEGHRARYLAAEQMAAELDDFENALKELPKVQGSAAAAAQQLLHRLQEKALAAESEKIFTSGDAPAVKITTRNVEKVKLRVWALDLKDYFEKKASTAGLLGLEVAVIAPDKEWEIDVKEYKRFKEIKASIELPKKDPGAYVVTASAGAIESTTVVVVSDLGMIARAGRKGATVIVQNLKTGAHEAKAVVRTAADGRHLKAWTAETMASRLAFLAESNGHLAFRDMDVSGQPVPPERKPLGVALTDRRAYAPEDEVRVRVIARDVVENGFALYKEKKVRFTAVSQQGVAFFEEEVALSAVGTAGASFKLLQGMSGSVRIDVHEAVKPQGKLLGQAHIRIGMPAPRVRHVDFIADDKPIFAGDAVDVTVILRDAWGRPMANRAVRVRTSPHVAMKDAMTGADGTVAVALRDTHAGTTFVEVEHEGVYGALPVAILPKGVRLSFDPGSLTDEPLFAGDRKSMTVVAKRADDSAVEGTFGWRVMREDVAGERSEVAKGDVTTNKEGKGELSFTAAEAGIYTVTVMMKDADGLPVRTQVALAAYDDKDERKVRLVAKADEFAAGQPMEFEVLSRLEKGLAFVTVEGEKVEQVVPVTLEKGRTAVKLGPPPSSTGDFTVAVHVMQANAYHADVREFRVKAPEIKIDLKKEVRPGEEITVKVTAAPGAEVILAVAEQVTTRIDARSFRPARPGAHFRGDSSAATTFAGRTQQLDEQLVMAMNKLRELDRSGQRVNMPSDAEDELKQLAEAQKQLAKELKDKGVFDRIGSGGGGGGRYGNRLGGKRAMELAELPPLAFLAATAGADGTASFTFKVPQGWDTYQVMAYAVDGSNAIATKSETFKARAPVTIEFRAPESAVEGEATSLVALLTNRSSQEQEVTLNETKVKVAARSTIEKTMAWTAAAVATISLDGIKQEQAVALRPKGPTTWSEAGGAFTGKKELSVEGEGAIESRAFTGPAALLEGLAGGRDEMTPASDAAARLIALIARHRHAKSDATKRAVMEFAARRAAGLADQAHDDPEWAALVYLAAAEAKSAEFDIAPDATLLKQRFAQAATDDVKALILFALARGGEAQYGYIHRLWRAADTLSPRALACVALALHAAKKPDEAKAAVERLVKLVKDDALVVFAIAEIDPANAILPKARAELLMKWPSTPFDRAMTALAMQSTPDKSAVTAVKIQATAERAVFEPTGDGTYYAFVRRATGKTPEAVVKVATKRTAEWPAVVVEGVTVWRADVTTKEPVENPSMAKVAAGESFAIKYEVTVTGPTTKYAVVELPRVTGLIVEPRELRVLLAPQLEAERKVTVTVSAYADRPGAYGEVEVVAAGAGYRDGWSMTHGERLGAGRVLFGKKKWKETAEAVAPLFEKGTLRDEAMIEAARMLAYAGIELGGHEAVVKYFEILKEKSPSEVVPFDKIRGVGKAYAAVKEHERAMQVHAGTCDAYFLQEANLVGALEELGRTRPAAERMKSLLLDHPDTTLTREMLFGLGQRLYTAARTAKDAVEKDEKKLTKAEMLAESSSALERHLAWYPAEKEEDRVALTLGSVYLEAASHAAAERTGRSSASRWPKSRYLDSFDYTQAVALFGQKKFAESLVLCDRLENFDYGAAANPGPGVMRELAVMMKAQVFHAKGELEKALENYKKVRSTQPDAERSIAFLEREAIAVAEVTVAPMAKGAEVELEYAGVSTAQVRAYKVDLAMLAMRRRGLSDAASIEVAGIRPVFEKEFKLDAPNAKRRERQKLSLELKEPGAYLVGVKAGDFFASGLVLRSDLSMTVQEEAAGLVRVNVANSATGSFAEGVKVTIFGTEDRAIASDKTDLRGIWERDGVRGLAVVVAEKEGHVAMYRGAAALGLRPREQPRAQEDERRARQRNANALDDQIRGANEQYEKSYQDNVQKKQSGVEVERTKK